LIFSRRKTHAEKYNNVRMNKGSDYFNVINMVKMNILCTEVKFQQGK